jgi:hypothetical protein
VIRIDGDDTSPTARRGGATTARRWGGFVLGHGRTGLLHVKLTGMLTPTVVRDLDVAVRRCFRPDATMFVLLDAATLAHVPQLAAHALHAAESQWRQHGAVTAWVSPSPYVLRLLDLALGSERLPVFPDLSLAQRAVAASQGHPSTVARGKLEVWSTPVH